MTNALIIFVCALAANVFWHFMRFVGFNALWQWWHGPYKPQPPTPEIEQYWKEHEEIIAHLQEVGAEFRNLDIDADKEAVHAHFIALKRAVAAHDAFHEKHNESADH